MRAGGYSNLIKKIGYSLKRDDGTYDFSIGINEFLPELDQELKKHIDVIFKVQPIIISYEALMLNFAELHQTIQMFNAELLQSGGKYNNHLSNVSGCLIAFTQKISNFLASATSFLSCTQVNLKNDRGEFSREYEDWNDFRKFLHRENFSYRLMYELRNYSQHYNIPIGNINITAIDLSTDSPNSNTRVCIVKSGLLNEKYNWKTLAKEIEQCEEELDILPLVNEYLFILRRIACKYLAIYKTEINICGNYLHKLASLLNAPENSILAVYLVDPLDSTKLFSSMEVIPVDQFNWIYGIYSELSSENGTE